MANLPLSESFKTDENNALSGEQHHFAKQFITIAYKPLFMPDLMT